MARRAHISLLDGDIRRLLTQLAVPTMIGVVLMVLMTVVDTFFVGQLGHHELAAMSFTFPVVSLVMSIAMGLGIGSTSAIARALGSGDDRRVRRLTTHAILLAVVIVIVLSLVGIATQDAVFGTLGADAELLPMLDEYMTIWYAGAVFLVVPMVGTGAMRADGDAETPMYIMGLAAVVNLALDPVLIFGLGPVPALGIRGAAIATVISRAITLLLTLAILQRRRMLDWHVPSLDELGGSWRVIASVGGPAAVSNALPSVATAVMTGLLASYGTAAVAAYGVASRIEGLLLIPPVALGAALTPFVGQNWGAHRTWRVEEGLRLSRRFVIVWGLAAWVVVAVAARSIAGLFTEDSETIELVGLYLWVVPASYGAAGVVSVISSVLNAIDRAVRATLLSAARSLFLAVPLAVLAASQWGVLGVFVGITAATLVTAGLATVWARNALRPVTPRTHRGAEEIQGIDERTAAVVDALLHALERVPALRSAPRRINTIGFYVGGFELGHVHRDGKLDLHVSPELHDALLDEGLVEHHRHQHDSGWVTHPLHSARDLSESVWLLELLSVAAQRARGELSQAQAEVRWSELRPSPALRAALGV